jgi:DNA polymerase-3 subunit delta'
MVGAQDLIDAAQEQAAASSAARDDAERTELARALGIESASRPPPWARSQFRELREAQDKRRKRSLRDALDRALLDLASYYRDVLMVQTDASVPLVNEELRTDVSQVARASTPHVSLRRLESIVVARERIQGNAAPQLAVEHLMMSLARA